jgi:pimeloyl-ACP methyl ester carboxylesterase
MAADITRYQDIFVIIRDGLRLHARKYAALNPAHAATARPVVCLPGLTRNGRDFHDLALALSSGPDARDVYTLDYRGRGLSDHDKDWCNYTVPREMLDVVDVMTAQGLHDAAIVGTSRGGLITMVLAAAQPGMIGAAVLNDIGPVLDMKGLTRIAAYVGRMPVPGTWSEAAKLVRELNAKAFPALGDSDWEPIARQFFNERNGKPVAGYDPALGRAFSVLDGPMPALWAQFDALKRVPVMVIRGEKSDLLSEATVEEMCRRHPQCSSLTVPGQGHAPFLRDEPTQTAIRRFFNTAEPARGRAQLTLVQAGA